MPNLFRLEKELETFKAVKSGKKVKKRPQPATQKSYSRRFQPVPALAIAVDYEVPGAVPVIAQPNSMACWATVYTMLHSWKNKQSLTIEDALNAIGSKWLNIYQSNSGLSARDKVDFVAEAGLVAEPPMNFSIEGWEQLLRSNGPLWVTTDEAPGRPWAIHARIITAMRGNGTPEKTFFTIIDPAGGRKYKESIAVFIQKYEEEVRRTGFTRIQVLHFQKGAQQQKSGGAVETKSFYSVSLGGKRPWPAFFHFPKGTKYIVDGPASYNGTGEVLQLTDTDLSFSLKMPQDTILGYKIPAADLVISIKYTLDGSKNQGSIIYNKTTYNDNNLTISTNGARLTIVPSVTIPGFKINEIAFEKENADEIDLDITINGSSHDFDLERIKTGSAKALRLCEHEIARGQALSDTRGIALNVPLINITHAGTYRLAYDRLQAHGYGTPEPAPARDKRIFRGQQALQDALNNWAPLISKVEAEPNLILTGGLYVNKPGQHGQGLAVDVDGLWWATGNKFLANDAPTDWYRYLRIEATLRRIFGTVLNYDYNAGHHDHWHCDLGGNTSWRRVESQAKFAQRVLKELHKENIGVDGNWGPLSAAAAQRAGFNFDTAGHWGRFLDDLINAQTSLP